MDLYFIRHAHAGDRLADTHDRYRHLSDRGHSRAAELAAFLNDRGITRVLSSPATRCVQTVAPLAESLGIEVEEHEALWEDSLRSEALALLEQCVADQVAVCSHGNIIPEVLELLADEGVTVKGRGCEKGSVWVLSWESDQFKQATYLSPKDANVGRAAV